MAKPGGLALNGPSCQGVSLQRKKRQKDRPPDFPYPLAFVFYNLAFVALQFLYSPVSSLVQGMALMNQELLLLGIS